MKGRFLMLLITSWKHIKDNELELLAVFFGVLTVSVCSATDWVGLVFILHVLILRVCYLK